MKLVRAVNIARHVAIKKLFRLGRWEGGIENTPDLRRPVLVELGSPRHRTEVLSACGKVWQIKKSGIKMMFDNRKRYPSQARGTFNTSGFNRAAT